MIQGDVFPVVDQFLAQYPEYHLFISGHSLDGATSAIAGLELQLEGYNPVVVTLAGPKFANAAQSAFVDQEYNTQSYYNAYTAGKLQRSETGYWRVAAVDDFVPVGPPGPLFTQSGLEFKLLTNAPLPQPNNDVWFKGHYTYKSIFAEFNPEGLFDWLHYAEHMGYIVDQTLRTVLEVAQL